MYRTSILHRLARHRAVRRCTTLVGTGLLAAGLIACAPQSTSGPPGQTQVQGPLPTATELPPRAEAPGFIDDGRTRVALLVPLSGPDSALGRDLQNAAELALFDVADDDFLLLVKDTGNGTEQARRVAVEALAEGAQLVVGPLYGGQIEAVAQAARPAGAAVLSFSNTAASAGNGAYVLGFLPQAQIERLVAYGLNQGLQRYAVLAPSNAYGEATVQALRQATAQYGGQLALVERFDAAGGGTAADAAVRRLASAAGQYDALLLPMGGALLLEVASLLPYYDLDTSQVQLMGTMLWEGTDIGSEQALNGGWYPAPQPEARSEFEARFRALHGQAPPRLATLAYDATALAAILARQPGGPDFDANSLTQASGFYGADGIFRLTTAGTTQRGYAVIEVVGGRHQVIDPAPESFEDLIN